MSPFTRLNLPEIRRKLGVSLEAIAERTKIGSWYLRAIELEEFDILPGCVYSVSYICQYAYAIDYNAELILAVYRERMRALGANPIISAPKQAHSAPRSRLLLWLSRS